MLQARTLPALIVAALTAVPCGLASAQTTPPPGGDSTLTTVSESSTPAPAPAADAQPAGGFAHDAGLYFTAPLHWNGGDWAWFAGSLAAIGASHHYDTDVRDHFTKNLTPTEISNIKSNDLQDALPAVAVFLGTWGYAALIEDPSGHREAWSMFEAATLSTVDAYALKYLIRREGPDQTSDPNAWEKSGGRSFPSEHATASFAIGTVLAEAGGDEYRWLRRVLGYGLGIGTSYLRLKHNAHWLSDTVAGGALGIASGQFALNHAYHRQDSGFSLVPVPGGAMLTYRMELQ
ncbi:MAG: phosphatase PAP2 family protein [Gammaproteobacteria bacterium]|nr:phosphatase PAP2 family protein [Gammaproteobacteria bacterium]